MAEVLRVVAPAFELRPVRDRPDPVVLRGITLAPKYGVEVAVGRARERRPAPAVASAA